MQNPDEPNLPFAQELEFPISPHANYPINFGFNQSLALASLSKGRQTYYDYMVKGDIPFPFGFGKIDGVKRFTESNAQNYRRIGYSVVKVEGTGDILIPKPPKPTTTGGGTTSNGHSHVFETLHPKQTAQLIKIGKDTTKLGVDMTVLGNKLTEAKTERDRIEAKVNANKAEHQDFHDKLEAIGQSIEQHNVGHGVGDVGGGILGGGMIALAVIGIGAYFLLRRKRK